MGDHAKYFLICCPYMAGSFTPTSGIMKKIVIVLVHVKIYARGGLVLAIYKAQFECEALRMLMAFKFGVPQGRYPFPLKENFILRNDQANSSTRLASTHNY